MLNLQGRCKSAMLPTLFLPCWSGIPVPHVNHDEKPRWCQPDRTPARLSLSPGWTEGRLHSSGWLNPSRAKTLRKPLDRPQNRG